MNKEVLTEIFKKIIVLSHSALGYMESFESNESFSKDKKENEEMKLKHGKIRWHKGTYELRYRRENQCITFYGRTQEEVQTKFKDFASKDKKVLTYKQKIILNDWIDKWLETYKKGKVLDTTLQAIKTVLKHLRLYLGDKDIKSIRNIDLQEMLNILEKNGYGNSKQKLKVYTQALFKQALINKLIKENPAENLEISKSETIHSQALTLEEQKKLLAHQFNNKQLHYFFAFCLYTGTRRGEALRFILSEDIKDDYIHIKGTKTIKSNRLIPYFATLKNLFQDVDEMNFTNLKNEYVTVQIKKCLPNHTVRDLRKTFATNCYQIGIAPKVVQQWLGHTNLDMTMNTYTDIRSEFELSEATKIKCIIPPKIPPKK